MKLSALTKMATFAVDAHESGDPTAAPELHAFCLANVEAIAEALSQDCARVREVIGAYNVNAFPAALLKTCKDGKIRNAYRDHADAKRDATVSERAAAFQESAVLDGEGEDDVDCYTFDGAALAALVKAAKPSAELFLSIKGYEKAGLVVPVAPLRKLDRIRPLADCRVTMTSPAFGEWHVTIWWNEVGHYKIKRTASRPDREHIPVLVPSMTDMVIRDQGIAA